MSRLLVVVLILLAGPVLAQSGPLPALYDVTGVAEDDVLNIRRAPDAGAEIVGKLPADARGVEVVARNATGTWGLVNTAEASGWTSMAFLNRLPGQEMGLRPAVTRCFGTEPFWAMTRADGTAGDAWVWTLSSPDRPDRLFEEAWVGAAQGRPDRFAYLLSNTLVRAEAVVAHGQCSDGMSDRSYGLTMDLILMGDEAQPRLLTGCCTLASPADR